MRTVCFLFLLTTTHNVTAQNSMSSPISFAGCYQLRVEAWHQARGKKDDFLPRRLQLTTKPSIGKGFSLRSLDPEVRGDLWMSSWHVNQDGTLQIDWSGGFEGYRLQLHRSIDELHGTAYQFTDTDKNPVATITVVARAAECRAVLK